VTELTTEVVRDPTSFLSLQTEWEGLRQKARHASVFLSHKWLRLSWEQHWRRFPNRLRVVLVREHGKLVMAGAFVLYLFNGWPAVHFLNSGTPQSDDVLYLPSGDTDRRARALLGALRRSLPFPMTLRAERLLDDSPILAGAAMLGWLVRTRQPVIDATLDLTRYGSFETYLQSMSAKTRSGYRRHLRDLMKLDRFSFRRETGEERFTVLRWLLDRKREWLVRKSLEATWLTNGSFDRLVFPLLRGDDAPEFWILTLRTGDRIIAATICFVERETLNYSKITHDPEFDRYSPGLTLNALMIREAFAAGLARVDLGYGNFDTKSRLTKQTHELMMARIHLG
jgi:CelD/BcsL family acetyltransferase involved in cellulose biosynthesis